MLPRVDHQFTQTDPCLIFKSSDGRTFSIGREVANLSSVWKDMLQVGEVDKIPNPISLLEHEEELLPFFNILTSFNSTFKASKEMENLDLQGLNGLLKLADKYGTQVVGFLAERDILKTVYKGKMFDQSFDSGDILTLFVLAERLELDDLVEIAAKLTLKIKNLVKAQPKSLDGFIERERHLLPLILFRERWEKIKNEILDKSVRFSIQNSDLKDLDYSVPTLIKGAGLKPKTVCPTCGHNFNSFGHASECATSVRVSNPLINEEGKAILLMEAFEKLEFEERYRPGEEDTAE